MVRYPAVPTVGEPRKPREAGGWNPASGEECQELGKGGTSRLPGAARRDQVPRGHSQGWREVGKETLSLGVLQGERPQPRFTVPAQEPGE